MIDQLGETATGPSVNPKLMERTLRARLAGRKLVCEMGIDASVHSDLIVAMEQLRDQGITEAEDTLERDYTAVTVSYLVAEGVYNYVGGNFWPNLTVKGVHQNLLGSLFERGIRKLGLEPFESLAEDGLRFVTPILAHGGIPRYCLQDFFRLLLDELRRGAPNASEVLARWRRTSSQLIGIDRPVTRFLLNGGEVSLDLLDRCIDMIRVGGSDESDVRSELVGLPDYICRAYLDLDLATRQSACVRTGSAVPPAVVRIDPWSGLGPTVLLPRVNREHENGRWAVVAQGMVATFEARLEPSITV